MSTQQTPQSERRLAILRSSIALYLRHIEQLISGPEIQFELVTANGRPLADNKLGEIIEALATNKGSFLPNISLHKPDGKREIVAMIEIESSDQLAAAELHQMIGRLETYLMRYCPNAKLRGAVVSFSASVDATLVLRSLAEVEWRTSFSVTSADLNYSDVRSAKTNFEIGHVASLAYLPREKMSQTYTIPTLDLSVDVDSMPAAPVQEAPAEPPVNVAAAPAPTAEPSVEEAVAADPITPAAPSDDQSNYTETIEQPEVGSVQSVNGENFIVFEPLGEEDTRPVHAAVRYLATEVLIRNYLGPKAVDGLRSREELAGVSANLFSLVETDDERSVISEVNEFANGREFEKTILEEFLGIESGVVIDGVLMRDTADTTEVVAPETYVNEAPQEEAAPAKTTAEIFTELGADAQLLAKVIEVVRAKGFEGMRAMVSFPYSDPAHPGKVCRATLLNGELVSQPASTMQAGIKCLSWVTPEMTSLDILELEPLELDAMSLLVGGTDYETEIIDKLREAILDKRPDEVAVSLNALNVSDQAVLAEVVAAQTRWMLNLQ